ncbi:hypothetical protein [Paenibacillus arenilitoris]|uniref:Uncharacterized protein n=1 Tax=Paenibacillus arenilitoris TaxID=2772299 RepID=A0A927CM84_9BACL|nr:hypothetical protein [Paenibacillus arenilitoris]MBD2869407.1 hypothetical protein [Paenibacillus arenilitoris]
MSGRGDCNSGGHKWFHGSKHKSNGWKDWEWESKGWKDWGFKSGDSGGGKEDGGKKNEYGHGILSKIGVGTPNVRIQFNGVSKTGVYLGIVGGSAALSVDGVVSYISLSAITAVSVGMKVEKKPSRKRKKVCFPVKSYCIKCKHVKSKHVKRKRAKKMYKYY